jgi:hypothetical protein
MYSEVPGRLLPIDTKKLNLKGPAFSSLNKDFFGQNPLSRTKGGVLNEKISVRLNQSLPSESVSIVY